eukprot:CAMPEP_0113914694 /NCGR_PEP_ID=MMETSP0780_2-20120614/30599_1 /TAXON_ID=652834 /ORGANISM="Palpitomonas bilix" /LENGTH=700 /DNA_ID=CAMNT_0000912741 /DNA_START=149 /DNA_END=2249 /DNA_ORIENTATION=+ /assembly_acc=CAM_ASM_000599
MTSHNVPASRETAQKCGVPFGFVFHPFAELEDDEDGPGYAELQRDSMTGQVDEATALVAVLAAEGISTATANSEMLGAFGCVTSVSQMYYSPVDGRGIRRDRMEKPELHLGTVEFPTTPMYQQRPPQIPHYLFAIDVSSLSMAKAVGTVIAGIRTALDALVEKEGQDVKVAFVTFDNTMNFYTIRKGNSPFILTVPDVSDAFVPVTSEFCVSLKENKEEIDALLDALFTMFTRDRRPPQCAAGAAAKAAALALAPTGGRVFLFTAVMPSIGEGMLEARDVAAKDKEKDVELMQPSQKSEFFTNLAADAAVKGVCFDLFTFAEGEMDLATFSVLAKVTGGELFSYSNFHAVTHGEKVRREVHHAITREKGTECVMRVRVSTGFTVAGHFGCFFQPNPNDVILAGMDRDKAVAVELANEGKVNEMSMAYVQVALLYTNAKGERKLRVFNLAVYATDDISNVFKCADLDTVVAFLAKKAAAAIVEKPIPRIREALLDRCVEALLAYRRDVTQASSLGQLVLPETLKHLLIFTIGLIKSSAFRKDASVSADERTASSLHLLASPTYSITLSSYPMLYPVTHLQEKVGNIDANTRLTCMPLPVALMQEKLNSEGVYLLNTGDFLILFVGCRASAVWTHDVFGVETVQNMESLHLSLPSESDEHQSDLAKRLGRVVARLQAESARHTAKYPQVVVARQSDPSVKRW